MATLRFSGGTPYEARRGKAAKQRVLPLVEQVKGPTGQTHQQAQNGQLEQLLQECSWTQHVRFTAVSALMMPTNQARTPELIGTVVEATEN